MKTSEFDYELPRRYIAQEPLTARDSSRLLVAFRRDNKIEEIRFRDIAGFFNPRDCIVLNNTKVIPARLFGRKPSGAQIELLFIRENSEDLWEVMVKPAKRVKEGTKVLFGDDSCANIVGRLPKGTWLVKLNTKNVKSFMSRYGIMPTPPYIKKELRNQGRYQTVYAQAEGAIAAPTAGLHFTEELLNSLRQKGIKLTFITLYVGLGTFRPIKADNIEDHLMDEEEYNISSEAAEDINRVKRAGGRIIAVGTTVTRALESAADKRGLLPSGGSRGKTSLFIKPGYKFKIVDCLLTNFHLPRSTNLILVSVFAGMSFVKRAYKYAVENKFRFYSFGDAMLII
ncbi:MAG: tRNA preQ1(34) S-adenosylmethionine ribosyltransferase-isomerase QueA [Candidatus Omnitrophica bacterium 4484_171]|nr:MAG: tRNA preQ1(34) S-adenosylmethionine ribosyltransferase-isomerase QueA [Candidatus Omnitrophica bacterium 4484_171]